MAILTAMPESTCSSMRLVSPSMSPLVSSTPRLTGPGCMTSGIRLCVLHERLADAVELAVFAERREVARVLALELDPQSHHDVGALHRLLAGAADLGPHPFDARGDERLRRVHGDFRPQLL